jgi:sortase A
MATKAKKSLKKNGKSNFPKVLGIVGNLLISASVVIIILTFWPVVKEEAKYDLNKALNVQYSVQPLPGTKQKKLEPVNTEFSIVIPKIGASAPVVSNVDPNNKDIYMVALKKGVAHALGTSFPGKIGNIFLFAHSTDTFYNMARYNAVFYLIGKLQKGDEIDVWYRGKKYMYMVDKVLVVDAKDTYYMGKIGEGSTLTLQTCYPPGTTLRRLVVTAKSL